MFSLPTPAASAAPATTRGAPSPLVLGQPLDDAPRERRVAGAALDRERLLALSAPAMEDLHRQLDSPGITVLLADSAGGVLRAIGARGALAAGARPPATPQANARAPAAADTTFPVSPAAPALPPGQLGIAVPILPPAGALLGFLDADAAPAEWLGHANALLHTAACIIEHRLIETEPQGFLLLRFHRYASVLGTPLRVLKPGGVLAVSDWLSGENTASTPEWAAYQRLANDVIIPVTASKYVTLLHRAGFTSITTRDRNAWYADLSRQQLAQIEGPLRQRLIAASNEDIFADWLAMRRAQTAAVAAGALRPTHLRAYKPQVQRDETSPSKGSKN